MHERGNTRLIIAGGGTGGHVYPGIAIYENLLDYLPGLEVMFVGVRNGMEEKILVAHGLPHTLISGRGLRGAGLLAKISAPFSILRSVGEATAVIRRFRPDAVVGTGGYASASAVIAAWLRRLPVVIQEQNSVPGLVNRRLSVFADLVLLSYEESKRHLSGRAPVSVVGNPLRSMPRVSRAEGCEYFGLEPDRPTVVVIGGSRGAHSLNVAGAEAAAELAGSKPVQFVLLTGEHDYESVRTALVDMADRVKVLRYLDDVHMAYAVADLAVARAGASTVFELAAWGVPTVFVPYPYAADDHQARNAAPLEERGGAVVIADRDLDARRLTGVVGDLLADEGRRSRMAAAMTSWSRPDAARAAAALIADVLKKKTADDRPRITPPGVATRRRSSLEVVRR